LGRLDPAKSNHLELIAQWAYLTGMRHWFLITFSVIVITITGSIYVSRMPMQEDIVIMLPDNDKEFATDYKLLEAAPFTRNILIDLESSDSNQVSLLTQTADRLCKNLQSPLISKVIGGLSLDSGSALLDWLYAHLPQLFTDEDAAILARKIEPNQIAEALQKNLDTLVSPEGVWLRKWLGRDPLSFRNQAFRKLAAVAMLSNARIEEGFIMDPTGRHLLLIAETTVSIGDSKNGQDLLVYLDKAIKENVPKNIKAHVVCAHRYTVANANTIKKDLVIVIVASSLGLCIVFLLLLRHWRAIFVFAAPSIAVIAAILFTAIIFGRISAITVGFGAVLLGIADDYGLHVFFALRRRQSDPVECVKHLAVPETVSWATTVSVFVILLWSNVPIQRQLAIFSIAGLTLSLSIAYLWLPRWVGGNVPQRELTVSTANSPNRTWIIIIWMAVILMSIPFCFKVQFDGNLRNIGVVPRDIMADELLLRNVWADPRGRAMVVVSDSNVESLLQANEKISAELSQICGSGQLAGLASLLPSRETQKKNLLRWRRFWNENGRLEQLRKSLNIQGSNFHFSQGAFEPFLQSLTGEQQPFDISELKEIAGPLMEPFFLQREGIPGLINFIPDDEKTIEAFNKSGLSSAQGISILSQKRFASILRRLLLGEFRRFLIFSVVIVILVLIIILRKMTRVMLCLSPAITGITVMLAMMTLLNMKINIFNVAAGVLVIGLSIDYGVFMVHKKSRSTNLSVITSAITTIVGFGALTLARHPAMFSLGITVVFGIIPSVLCSLFVLPALQNRQNTD
jgi:predicted exporter